MRRKNDLDLLLDLAADCFAGIFRWALDWDSKPKKVDPAIVAEERINKRVEDVLERDEVRRRTREAMESRLEAQVISGKVSLADSREAFRIRDLRSRERLRRKEIAELMESD
jgi:hypothetical protein